MKRQNMTNSKKLELQKKIEKDLRQIETELAEHPELEQMQVTAEMDAALMDKIRKYEKEKAEKEQEEKKNTVCLDREIRTEDRTPVYYKKKKRKVRWFTAFAAVLVLVLGISMTSVGSKSYWKEIIKLMIGDETAWIIDVEDMDKKTTKDLDIILVYQEIDKKLGILPVRMRYKPAAMKLRNYEIDEELQSARLLFKYRGMNFRYTVYASQEDSSWAEKEEDVIIEKETKIVDGVEIHVEAINKPKQAEKTRVAKFEYEGMHYELKGMIEEAEFEKILENLYFL